MIHDSITADYIFSNLTDRELAEHLLRNYADILDNANPSDVPSYCTAISNILGIHSRYPDNKDIKEEYLESALLVSRIGLKYLQTGKNNDPSSQAYTDMRTTADLLLSQAVCFSDMNRHFAALQSLDYAEKIYGMYSQMLSQASSPQQPVYYEQVMYEYCRAMEAKVWFDYVDIIDDEYKPAFYACITSYLEHSCRFFEENLHGEYSMECESYYNYFRNVQTEAFIEQLKRPVMDFQTWMELNDQRPGNDYKEWCFNRVLFLNPYVEIPSSYDPWLRDIVDFELSPEGTTVWDDVVMTYDHCRRIMYRFQSIDIESRYGKDGRDEDVESVIDCYIRLYSLLDKMTKVIDEVFSLGLGKRSKFHDLEKRVKDHENRYLRTIGSILIDMFPKLTDLNRGNCDMHYSVSRSAYRASDIRNHIMHGAFRITNEDSETLDGDVISIPVWELEFYTSTLMYNIREIVLTAELAEKESKIPSTPA